MHALIAAADPVTGETLSDRDICNDLLIFMLAGHDTTATALTYALWELGRHPRHRRTGSPRRSPSSATAN